MIKLRHFLAWLFPTPNELTAFLTAFICLLLMFSYPEFSDFLSGNLEQAPRKAELWVILMGLGATLGFFLSFYHVFSARPKSYFEKVLLSLFTLGANGIAGVVAGFEILPVSWSIWAIFPIWNIVMGYSTLYQLGLDKTLITDENMSLLEVFIASIVLLFVFFLAYFRLHLSWALTFSICMFYASLVTPLLKWAIHYFFLQRRQGANRAV